MKYMRVIILSLLSVASYSFSYTPAVGSIQACINSCKSYNTDKDSRCMKDYAKGAVSQSQCINAEKSCVDTCWRSLKRYVDCYIPPYSKENTPQLGASYAKYSKCILTSKCYDNGSSKLCFVNCLKKNPAMQSFCGAVKAP